MRFKQGNISERISIEKDVANMIYLSESAVKEVG